MIRQFLIPAAVLAASFPCVSHAQIAFTSGELAVWDFADGVSFFRSVNAGNLAPLYVGVSTNGGFFDTTRVERTVTLSPMHVTVTFETMIGGNGRWYFDSLFTLDESPLGQGWEIEESGPSASVFELFPDATSSTPGTLNGTVASAGDYVLRINNPEYLNLFWAGGTPDPRWTRTEDYALSITAVPSPGIVGVLSVAGLLMTCRRRR